MQKNWLPNWFIPHIKSFIQYAVAVQPAGLYYFIWQSSLFTCGGPLVSTPDWVLLSEGDCLARLRHQPVLLILEIILRQFMIKLNDARQSNIVPTTHR